MSGEMEKTADSSRNLMKKKNDDFDKKEDRFLCSCIKNRIFIGKR